MEGRDFRFQKDAEEVFDLPIEQSLSPSPLRKRAGQLHTFIIILNANHNVFTKYFRVTVVFCNFQ